MRGNIALNLSLERMALQIEKGKIEIALRRGDFLRVATCAQNASAIQGRIATLEALAYRKIAA